MLGIKDFEFWSGDRSIMEYMISKLIIAKLIEKSGTPIPDNFNFHESFHLDYVDREFFLEPVVEFMDITSIGKMQQLPTEDDVDDLKYVLHFQILEEVKGLSEEGKLKFKSIVYGFQYDMAELEPITVSDSIEDCSITIDIEYWMQISIMKDICKVVLSFHQQIQKLLIEEKEVNYENNNNI